MVESSGRIVNIKILQRMAPTLGRLYNFANQTVTNRILPHTKE